MEIHDLDIEALGTFLLCITNSCCSTLIMFGYSTLGRKILAKGEARC